MPRQSKTDWAKLEKMTEEEVSRNAQGDPDAQPTDEAFWIDAKKSGKKISVSLKLEADVVDWFKSQGKDFQTLINAVLRAYKDTHH